MNDATLVTGRDERRSAWERLGALGWTDLGLMVLGSWGLFGVGAVLLGVLLLGLLVAVDLRAYSIPVLVWAVAGAMGLEAAALLGAVYLLGLRRCRLRWSAVGLQRTSPRWLVAALGLGLVCLVAARLVAAALGGVELPVSLPGAAGLEESATSPLQVWGAPAEPFPISPAGPSAASRLAWLGAVGVFLMGALVVPFAEEVFFRGVLYASLRSRWGIWAGALISALIFGAVHLLLANAIVGLVIGLAAALAYERSRSLWPAVIIHAVVNGAQLGTVLALLSTGALQLTL